MAGSGQTCLGQKLGLGAPFLRGVIPEEKYLGEEVKEEGECWDGQ